MSKFTGFSAAVAALIGAAVWAPAFGATYEAIHHFSEPTGYSPEGALVLDSNGVLYGTTNAGGRKGGGTMFRMVGTRYEVLHDFGFETGYVPRAGLTLGRRGELYGTTLAGGTWGKGVVFRLDPSGGYRQLPLSEGASPYAGVTLGPDGSCYGVTSRGGSTASGSDNGTVFKIEPDTDAVTTIHTFSGTDGIGPEGKLLWAHGALHGTAARGGTDDRGTLFALSADGSGFAAYKPTKGARFTSGLTMGKDGRLWGVASGNRSLGSDSFIGSGGIYRIDFDGRENVVHRFSPEEGSLPNNELLLGIDGMFYGTMSAGGAFNLGTVFRFNPVDETLQVLHDFRLSPDDEGVQPRAGLAQDSAGVLYGTASSGGKTGGGVVFRLTP
jgi:uncharacterized repeat protein (TIGR03803 family)